MKQLFQKYNASSFKDLDIAMKNDPEVLYGKSFFTFRVQLYNLTK